MRLLLQTIFLSPFSCKHFFFTCIQLNPVTTASANNLLQNFPALRLSRVSVVNSHEMTWEGRNFEVNSTDLLWTGYEAGKIWAILSEGHDAKPRRKMPPARRLDLLALFPAFRANNLSTHFSHFFIILCRVGHFKAATIKWFAYIWKSTSVLEPLAPG